MIDIPNVKKYLAKEPYDEKLFLSTLDDIVKLVVKRHFGFDDWEELRAIGLLKCVELLESSYIDPKRGTLLNFLYSGVRNTIGNHRRSEARRTSRFEVDTERVEADEASEESPFEGRELLRKHLKAVVTSCERFGVNLDEAMVGFSRHYDLNRTGKYFAMAFRVATWRAQQEIG